MSSSLSKFFNPAVIRGDKLLVGGSTNEDGITPDQILLVSVCQAGQAIRTSVLDDVTPNWEVTVPSAGFDASNPAATVLVCGLVYTPDLRSGDPGGVAAFSWADRLKLVNSSSSPTAAAAD
jgi:hypothetical protein